MKKGTDQEQLVVGLDIPAAVGMDLSDVATPALIIDLDAFEHNVAMLRDRLAGAGVRLRAHSKTHKSVDIARYQIDHGGASGICCQKVAEAEVMVAGGITDVMVSNQVVDPRKIARLAQLAKTARVLVCVDDLHNVDDLSAAAKAHDVIIECLVEIDCGAGRCGVQPGEAALGIAQKIESSTGLSFAGLQSYQGAAQHVRDYAERRDKIDLATRMTTDTLALLKRNDLDCTIVAGAGTGSYSFEAASGIYNEMQCGSYIFMDADYQRVLDSQGEQISEFGNSLFIWTSIMSKTRSNDAICDAGLKVMSVDSGLPVVYGRDDVEYIGCSDEHGVIADPDNRLKLNDRLKLVPGHCDPTCNLHDWYVGIRNDKVECLWPVSARGMAF
ncbi:MAG: DSD1 family PLP-dependent enzyme [Gammaproteobacteria bacterium]|nr:DSD1 family PLP-dependent enzyme [Gammaproteobacteria bacterium]MDH3856686.1 DSD1 family PLP-dependent enzyme [Gammaproteobacteria bacterium]